MTIARKSTLLLLVTLAIAIAIFLKNAWVSEDSYILFRSIEQLFAGNGPVWNPHERVQVYTSPLWYCLLALVRVFSADAYLNVLAVSFALWVFTVLALRATFRSDTVLLISVLLFSASTGFFDYTSSGLENVLAYAVIAAYVPCYLRLFAHDGDEPKQAVKLTLYIKSVLFLFGLIICVRHDLALLLAPPTVYAAFKHRETLSVKQWVLFGTIALLPFVLHSLFSLIYYGFPLPNTAYAKLKTGIKKSELLAQGIRYCYSSLKHDSITLLAILAALVLSLLEPIEGHKGLGYGIAAYLYYVVYIGGDFMQGRFLSYTYMVSVIILLLPLARLPRRTLALLVVAVVGYLIFYPHTPFNSPLDHCNYTTEWGIADERGFYFSVLSLHSYVRRIREKVPLPDHRWAKGGYEFRSSSDKITTKGAIGIFGYYAGTEKIIIDPLGLSNPLLARMPVRGEWRIGHFEREIPDGYMESIVDADKTITDPHINAYYEKLKLLTQDEALFSPERLETILLFNLGRYDYLLAESTGY
jgi:arabinofuranosyltransferase